MKVIIPHPFMWRCMQRFFLCLCFYFWAWWSVFMGCIVVLMSFVLLVDGAPVCALPCENVLFCVEIFKRYIQISIHSFPLSPFFPVLIHFKLICSILTEFWNPVGFLFYRRKYLHSLFGTVLLLGCCICAQFIPLAVRRSLGMDLERNQRDSVRAFSW